MTFAPKVTGAFNGHFSPGHRRRSLARIEGGRGSTPELRRLRVAGCGLDRIEGRFLRGARFAGLPRWPLAGGAGLA